MMAQKLMAEKRDDPFSDSRFFAGKMRPSMDDIENPTRLSDMAGPAYGAAATGSLFVPGSGFADVFGGLANPSQPGEMLPSFGANVRQGNYLDAGLQTLGVAGDVLQAGSVVFPPAAVVGTMLKAPRAARVADAAMDAAKAEDVLRTKYPDVELDVSETKKGLTLSKIVVPEGQRSKGVGSAVMSDLVSYADSKGLPLAVTPDSTFGGSKGRLEDFYKRFGFVRNKGRNKDFAFMETFVRQPKTDPNQATGAARVALSPEITRAISRNTDRNAKKVAKDLRQEGLLDVDDRGQSEAFYAEFERIKSLKGERKAAKPDRIDDLERNKNVRSLKADRLKAQKPITQSPMFEAWTKPNRERVLNSTYDSATIDAEARLATVEAIAREAKKRGLEVYYTSKGQKGRAGSRYIELPDGGKVRVSDHELPDTAQRQYTRSQGIGNFADEIIVSDWETSSVDDYLKRVLGEE
jgi:GNAT superfamily N-acetyltransferase